MDNTLIVKVLEALQDLGHVDADEVLGELAVGLADGVEGAIFAVPVLPLVRGQRSYQDCPTLG
jgi:hypothetical protein